MADGLPFSVNGRDDTRSAQNVGRDVFGEVGPGKTHWLTSLAFVTTLRNKKGQSEIYNEL